VIKAQKGKDLACIGDWFNRLSMLVQEHGIKPTGCYNMDEAGFLMSYVKAAPHIVRYSERALQKEPHLEGEWTTVIETLSAVGRNVPPYITFAAKKEHTSWAARLDQLPIGNTVKQAPIGVSDNGWSSLTHARTWLGHFHHHTWPHKLS